MSCSFTRRTSAFAAVVTLCLSSALVAADDVEEIFSGPQVDEPLVGFKAIGVFDDDAGKEVHLIADAGERPLLLVFVHDPLTRPSAAVARGLASFGWEHRDKLATALVFLHDDRSAESQYLRRVRRALDLKVPVAVSLDGVEGPGAYGLNRHASLTVLTAKDGKVTGNFALVQPSTTDGPKILAEAARLIDVAPPSQVEFDKLCYGERGPVRSADDEGAIPRSLLAPVIRKNASDEQVAAAADKVEAYVAKNEAARKRLGQIARTIVEAGKLADYGTPAAQVRLKQWAEKYGAEAPADDSPADPGESSPREPARGSSS